MGTKTEPEWLMFEGESPAIPGQPKLVAYAKRAKNAGWFVRISELNGNINTDKIYINDDVFPPAFMNLMLSMHKNPNHNHNLF